MNENKNNTDAYDNLKKILNIKNKQLEQYFLRRSKS